MTVCGISHRYILLHILESLVRTIGLGNLFLQILLFMFPGFEEYF